MFTQIAYFKDSLLAVKAKGKLDIYNAPDYLDEIKEYLKRYCIKELILDFSEISFIASIGLRAILEIYKILKEQDCSLKLKNVNKEVLNAFKITGFDDFLTIENE